MESRSMLKDVIDNILLQKIWSKEISLHRGDYLKTEGTIDTNLYLVEEGSLRIFIHDESDEKTIRFGYQGDLIASLDSYISEKSSPLFIQAIRKTKVKVIRKYDFTKMLDNNSELKASWILILGVLLLDSMEQEIDILLHDSRLDALESKVSEIEKTDVDVIELQTRIVRLELIIQALVNL